MDRESLSFGEGRHALRGAAEFVDRLHPSDRVALYPVWNSCARIDFTTDHRRVREAVARMGGQDDPWSLLGPVELDAHVGITMSRSGRDRPGIPPPTDTDVPPARKQAPNRRTHRGPAPKLRTGPAATVK